jgi:threonine synthase
MPARGFVAALNVNRAFADFLERGTVAPRPSIPTYSNAMDVGNPSNLERVRWLYRNDLTRLRKDVTPISISDEETAACIAEVHARTGYVLDPHSAVGVRAHERVAERGLGPTVVLATAHPAKFPDVVERAIGREVPLPPGIASVMESEEHMKDIGATLGALTAALDAR